MYRVPTGDALPFVVANLTCRAGASTTHADRLSDLKDGRGGRVAIRDGRGGGRRYWWVGLLAGLAAALCAATPASAAARGTLQVVISAPGGVAANVDVHGRTSFIAAK